MNLSDLLTELRENILHDRSDRIAGTSDYMWSDATLIRYINEAHRRFARLGLVIHDASNTSDPTVTQITLADGVDEYPLHESVLAVVSARVTGDQVDLTRTGHAPLGAYQPVDTMFFDPATVAASTSGKPLAYTTDERISPTDSGVHQRVTLKVYPTPTADYDGTTIDLRVLRLPLKNFTAADMKALPEIPEDHHLEMLDWAAYLALRIVDDDAGHSTRAKEFQRSFLGHVGDARRAVMRKLFAPQPWGFGRNGFSWDQGHG